MHKLKDLYKSLYSVGNKLSKRDKLGLHAQLEQLTLETLSLTLEASLNPPIEKHPFLTKARIKTEILKHLVRTEHDLKLIDETTYISLASQLQEISKMVNGWIKDNLQKTRPPARSRQNF